jgi:hypothetical protein
MWVQIPTSIQSVVGLIYQRFLFWKSRSWVQFPATSSFRRFGRGFNSKRQHMLSIPTSTSILFVNSNICINRAKFFKMSGRGGIKMVAVDAVVVLTEDAVRDEVRTTLDRPVQWKSICTNLGTNVFDYGQKSAADQM